MPILRRNKMKGNSSGTRGVLLIAMLLCGAVCALADEEQSTEIQGYFQTYRNFSFTAGHPSGQQGYIDPYKIPNTPLNGGGFAIGRNIAPWFAMYTQFTIFGRAEGQNNSFRIIHNLEGLRWQTKKYGPLQLYAKFGLGFAHYSVDVPGTSFGETKFTFGYGGGAFIWANEHFGLMLEASHNHMGVPNLTDFSGRDKWDSGVALTTGLAVRF
jgi:hypothetical protein